MGRLNTMANDRKAKLQQWVLEHLPPGTSMQELEIVSGDASFRRYFRGRLVEASIIAVDAPPDLEDSRRFGSVADLLAEAPVNVPKVLAADYELGFLLQSDLGDDLYLDQLKRLLKEGDEAGIDRLYREAIDSLLAIQQHVDKEQLDPYDRNELRREMALFDEWFVEALLEIEIDDEARAIIERCYRLLENSALAQPRVAVHRDYHSRNLMLLPPGASDGYPGPGIIDFQDAVSGPYTYDLVSLLRDCYIRWPRQQIRAWAQYYFQLAGQAGLTEGRDEGDFLRDFDLMGLQRHLKVMGIFARLAIRDKKPRYLADIPLVIRYFLEVSRHYPELAEFINWFKQAVMPEASSRLSI